MTLTIIIILYILCIHFLFFNVEGALSGCGNVGAPRPLKKENVNVKIGWEYNL